jgi:hypothetical protein
MLIISYVRTNKTLPQHLYLLTNLLLIGKQDPLGDKQDAYPRNFVFDHLIRYVIATCHPKMRGRLNHAALSQPYLNSLKKINKFHFYDLPRHWEPPLGKEINNDRLFLASVHDVALNHDPSFIKVFPKITHQAKLASEDKPFQFYSRDTCQEFHDMLLFFLQCFQTSLNDLWSSRSTTDVPEGSAAFESHLGHVKFYGYVLHKLSRGSALQIHLQVIEPLLERHHANMRPTTGKEENDDEELEAVQPFVTTGKSEYENVMVTLWKSYRDWLRLVTVHFDAVDILARYFTSPRFTPKLPDIISLKILVIPRVDTTLLPWKTLLTSSDHFPTDQNGGTNDEILQFLSDALSVNPQASLGFARNVKTCWEKRLEDKDRQVEQIRDEVNNEVAKLSTSKLPGWSEGAAKLTQLVNRWTPANDRVETGITKKIQSFYDIARFFVKLHTTSNNEGFSGMVHCEACLFSLQLDQKNKDLNIDENLKNVLAEMKVGDGCFVTLVFFFFFFFFFPISLFL